MKRFFPTFSSVYEKLTQNTQMRVLALSFLLLCVSIGASFYFIFFYNSTNFVDEFGKFVKETHEDSDQIQKDIATLESLKIRTLETDTEKEVQSLLEQVASSTSSLSEEESIHILEKLQEPR